MNHYKLIVIGAGMCGLSTALSWQKVYGVHNNDVLIVEKNPTVGGCVTSFARKGYIFDTTQIIPDVSDLLSFFDVDIPLLRFENYYARLFLADIGTGKSRIIPIPSSVEAFEDMLLNHYPEDAVSIRRFFSYCLNMHKELNYLKTEAQWFDIPGILLKCPKIIINSGLTYKQFLRKFRFRNRDIEQILDIFSSFSGLSGDRCAALLTACAMVTTLKGSYRPLKGFIHFPIALKDKYLENGGALITKAVVGKILTLQNKVKGIELEDGTQFTADYVVCTADTKVTLEKLVGEDIFKKAGRAYFKKIKNVDMSPSGFAIQLGLDDAIDLEKLGFNCGYNVLSSSVDAHELMFRAWSEKKTLMSATCFHLAVICPSLMTGGKQTLIIHVVPVPSDFWIKLREENYENYLKEKADFSQFYIQVVEKYMIPELTKHIQFIDVSTPATYKRYIGTATGSQYDMLPVPSNFGKNRLKTRTPIKGLFIPKFSHGIWPALQSGLQVVDMISGGKIMQGNSSYKSPKINHDI